MTDRISKTAKPGKCDVCPSLCSSVHERISFIPGLQYKTHKYLHPSRQLRSPFHHKPHPSLQLRSSQIHKMKLQHLVPAVFFSASALAATFNGFSDTACQRYDGTYIPVTAAQLQDLVVQEWATTDAVPEASRFLTTPDDKKKCPSNEDDTYKWVSLHDLGVLPDTNT